MEVLIIDDVEANFNSLKNEAASFNILLRYARFLDEGIKEVEENRNIAAVILDGKGLLNSNQQNGSETVSHVHEGLTQLRLIEEKQDRYIPKFVLTAWYELLQDSINGRAPLYDKNKIGDDIYRSRFFKEISESISKTDDYKIKSKYADVFKTVGNKYLPFENYGRLHLIFTNVEKRICQESDFNIIRSVFESLLKRANKIDDNFLPNSLFYQDGRPNYEYCIRYLGGGEVIDQRTKEVLASKQTAPIVSPHVHDLLYFVKSFCSEFSHAYQHQWTFHAFNSAAFALCEILIWFKQYVDNNYSKLE